MVMLSQCRSPCGPDLATWAAPCASKRFERKEQYRMRKKFFLWSLLGIMLCIFAMLCVGQFLQLASQNKQEQEIVGSDVPEDVIKCLTDFLEALKVSTEDSAQYAYFPNADIELAHKNSGITLISYSIEESRKISDNLYAFNLLQEDSFEPGEIYRI